MIKLASLEIQFRKSQVNVAINAHTLLSSKSQEHIQITRVILAFLVCVLRRFVKTDPTQYIQYIYLRASASFSRKEKKQDRLTVEGAVKDFSKFLIDKVEGEGLYMDDIVDLCADYLLRVRRETTNEIQREK